MEYEANSRPHAELRKAKAGVEKYQVPYVVYWNLAEKVPYDLFSFIREARMCCGQGMFLAAIALASATVELIINKDRRMRDLSSKKWLTLSSENLRGARDRGLPVNRLLVAAESLDTGSVQFIVQRHKVAHGDIGNLVAFKGGVVEYLPDTHRAAVEQVMKAQEFIVEWFNTAPEVQESHIKAHEWPTT